MVNQDYYEVLGVSKTATQDQIKKAFRAKAATLHPDNKETGNESRFKELVTAYEILSDENKRSMYDRYGPEGVAGTSRFEGFDVGAFADLGEVFEYFFGGGLARGQSRTRTERGADLKTELRLDFLEAIFGANKKLTIKRLEACTGCTGTGAAAGSHPVTCNTCHGQGQVRQTNATLFGHFTQILSCPTCEGEGTKIDRLCSECKGKGQMLNTSYIELDVPAGVDNGSRIRVPRAGNQGRKGAPPGDLYVIIHVAGHPVFQREGVTIHVKQPISFSMAALGGELTIETVSGKKQLKIPAGTQTGTTLNMRDEGVPYLDNPRKRGSQLVHLIVETPSKLSAEERQLFKKLADLRGENPGLNLQDKQVQGKQQSLLDTVANVLKLSKASDGT